VRSETVIPSFSNSPWIRGAPQRKFAAAMRRMRARTCESIRGLPGRRRERRLQHPRNPLRDANGRPWPARQAPGRPSTEATTVVSTARADGHTGGSVDPNEPARSVGGVGQDSRRGGLDARSSANVNDFSPGRDIGKGQEVRST
jgi:hypothetical protein